MRRRNRDINIFSMSALDLFASALGAFILIAVIALPYYLKTDHLLLAEARKEKEMRAKIEGENNQLLSQLGQKNQQMEALKKQLEAANKFAILGLITESNSFVVIVDMSGSMKNYEVIVRNTFNTIISAMNKDYKLQVIGYQNDSDIISWKPPYALQSMDANGKVLAKKFIGSIISKFSGGTPTYAALQEALKYDVESIILMTDGAPTDKKSVEIINIITSANSNNKEIHTIALGDYTSAPVLTDFLQTLAKRNRGGFIGVSN